MFLANMVGCTKIFLAKMVWCTQMFLQWWCGARKLFLERWCGAHRFFLQRWWGAHRFVYKIGVLHTDFSIKLVLHTDFSHKDGVVHRDSFYKVDVVHTDFSCKDGVGCLAIPHIWLHLAGACGPQTCFRHWCQTAPGRNTWPSTKHMWEVPKE